MNAGNVIESTAWIAVLLLPFFIVFRWRGGGFLVAVCFGWGIIHAANTLIADAGHEGDEARIYAVFAGLWAALGFVFMSVWCFVCAVCVATGRAMINFCKVKQ